MKSNKFLYYYYFFLFLMLALYTNMSSSPNIVIRMGYLLALVVPLFNKPSLFPAVILCTLCVSQNTFAYPLAPTEMIYYFFLAMTFVFFSYGKGKKNNINPLFIIILLYVSLDETILQQHYSTMLTTLLFVFLLFLISKEDEVMNVKFLPFTFIILSLSISYWTLFCPEARIVVYNSADDIDQTGWKDPNYLGCALGTGLVLAVNNLLTKGRTKIYLYAMIITIVLSVMALLSIASRGISVSVGITVGLMMLTSKVKTRTKVLTILGLGVFIIFLYTNQYADFLIARFNADDGTGSHRTVIWTTKLSAFFENGNPFYWFFGYGFDQGWILGFGTGYANHNDFVAILIYYGFVGLFLFISALLYPIRICSKKMKPLVVAFIVYLVVCSMSIEPLAAGNIAYISFYFYIIQLARHSRQIQYSNE